MHSSGQLRQLSHQTGDPISYWLELGSEAIQLNELLETPISITFEKKIQCVSCGREIKKTYNSGYCYPCFRDLPENDLCIVKPSLCHYQEGTCRDSEWGEHHCMQPHYVYLALSSNVKVGLTRKDNELRRWTDQGAVRGVVIAELPTRKIAGDLELELSQYVSDRTDWRKMLKDEVEEVDLAEVRAELLAKIPDQYREFLLPFNAPTQLQYPLCSPAHKLKSFDLLKQPVVQGTLLGIKGQYLILDTGVFNVRKHGGFHVRFSHASQEQSASNL